ncbi:MAG: GTPase [Candidatus Heimdallarchaeaceae archaeon]|jgi:ribosome-interacting GTPase 1
MKIPKPYAVMMEEIKERLKGKTGIDRAREIQQLLKEIPWNVGDYRRIKDGLRKELKELEVIEQAKKASRSRTKTKKSTPQFAIVGVTNCGKSTLINNLTGSDIPVGSYPFTTTEPQYRTLEYDKISFQLVEIPAIYEEVWDDDKSTLGMIYSTDCLLILGRSFDDFEIVLRELEKHNIELIGDRMKDGFTQETPRKIPAFLIFEEKAERLPSSHLKKTSFNDLEEIKKNMINLVRPIRIYTMNQFNEIEEQPIAFYKDQITVKEVINKVSKGKEDIFKDAVILEGGPEGRRKRVGITYELSDNDIIHLTFFK